jgi:circadian clock protein KaiC
MTKRIQAGCDGLDQVLHGGVPANTITVIMGAPGTGKSIIAEQIAFSNASEKTPVLYLTTISEPLEKFILHGQNYSYFDTDKVGVSVFYEDLGVLLRTKGVDELPNVIRDLFIKYRPAFVFVDSFKAIADLFASDMQRRTVFYDLATALSACKCNSFLIGEYSQDSITNLPEFAIADVVLNLVRHSTNVRDQRFLKVEKLRGSKSITGAHAFKISSDGVLVYPPILTPPIAPFHKPHVQRVNSGIKGLDDVSDAGFWRGSSTLIVGPSGSGKTVVCLHFLHYGVVNDEPSLYVGFQENPYQLARVMQNLGWDSSELLADSRCELMYRSPVEMQLDSVAAEIFSRVREGKVRRVVIDALGDLERCSIDRQQFADFIYALTQWFAVENVTLRDESGTARVV